MDSTIRMLYSLQTWLVCNRSRLLGDVPPLSNDACFEGPVRVALEHPSRPDNLLSGGVVIFRNKGVDNVFLDYVHFFDGRCFPPRCFWQSYLLAEGARSSYHLLRPLFSWVLAAVSAYYRNDRMSSH